jgi:hypothetical protein
MIQVALGDRVLIDKPVVHGENHGPRPDYATQSRIMVDC